MIKQLWSAAKPESSPSISAKGFGERCKLPPRGGVPAAESVSITSLKFSKTHVTVTLMLRYRYNEKLGWLPPTPRTQYQKKIPVFPEFP